MSYLRTVPPEDATGPVKAMYDQDLAARGQVASYTRAFSTRPEVMTGWLALKDAITSGMDPRLYELATVAAATAIRSSYCSLVHGQILAARYYPPEEFNTLRDEAKKRGIRYVQSGPLVRSSYRQPFGTFSGVLPGGLALTDGYGVMEHHDVWW